jgi:pimeloyl-ACP methyl ester carboxylesterase
MGGADGLGGERADNLPRVVGFAFGAVDTRRSFQQKNGIMNILHRANQRSGWFAWPFLACFFLWGFASTAQSQFQNWTSNEDLSVTISSPCIGGPFTFHEQDLNNIQLDWSTLFCFDSIQGRTTNGCFSPPCPLQGSTVSSIRSQNFYGISPHLPSFLNVSLDSVSDSYFAVDTPTHVSVSVETVWSGTTGSVTGGAKLSQGSNTILEQVFENGSNGRTEALILQPGVYHASAELHYLSLDTSVTYLSCAVFVNPTVDTSVDISFHRGASVDAFTNAFPGTGVDIPLIPVSDPAILAQQSHWPQVASGLVADGVTPLVFKIDQNTAAQASYNVTVSDPGLSPRIHILNGGGWSDSPIITFNGTNTTGFAYMDGVTPDAVFATGQTELSVTLTLTNTQDPTSVTTKVFYVRRSPIFLVHGYNSSASTWSNEFLSALSAATIYLPNDPDSPDSFIRRLSYGQANDFNTWGGLPALAGELDTPLRSEENVLHQNWAFTRYDVVAHSQGGVLTRMLCAQNASPITANLQFKGPENFNRGRFRRVITIGSPHNGSTLPYYVNSLQGLYGVLPKFLGDLLQPKFNPFGDQIHWINDSSATVDPDAKFRLITATITGGDVPPLPWPLSPLCYSLLGLNKLSIHQIGLTRGEIVLKNGSDGVVDIQSQEAGTGTPVSQMEINICHALPPAGALSGAAGLAFFGTSSAETTEPSVGSRAADLLTLPVSLFGAFQLPVNLSDTRKAEIDAEVPFSAILDLIRSLGARGIASTGSVSYTFAFTPDPAEPLDGVATWYAEVFGPNGVSLDGLTVTPDPSDSTHVTVDVDASVQGDVALYLSYNSTTGHLVVGRPFLVVSIPTGANLTGIELHPAQITATVGDMINLEIWRMYDNGSTSELFIQSGNATFSSSNTSVALVDSGTGQLVAAGPGDATVTGTYAGFTGGTTVQVTASFGNGSNLLNISTRLNVQTGDNVLIGGFIITGTDPKRVIVRGIGPSLGLQGVLADPTLELHEPDGTVVTNDNWRDTQEQEIIDTTIPPTNDLESAIVATLNPGPYTVIVAGKNGGTGIGVVEAYDLDQAANSQLANISTRGFVETSDNVMIGGFIIGGGGGGNSTIVVRGIGPSLTAGGVAGALQDPTLELHDSNGAIIASNDDWMDSADKQAIIDDGLAPTNDKESALLATLAPGAYTAIVGGVNNTTGVGLVEAYNLH